MKFRWSYSVAFFKKRDALSRGLHRHHAEVSFGVDAAAAEDKTDLRRRRGQRPQRTPLGQTDCDKVSSKLKQYRHEQMWRFYDYDDVRFWGARNFNFFCSIWAR